MRFITLFFATLFSVQLSTAQVLVEVESVGSLPQSTVNIPLSFIGLRSDDGLDVYIIRYTMDNLAGEPDTVSGLFVRPTNADDSKRFPVLVYQHGTTATKFGVPSRAPAMQDAPYFYASQGYACIAPDFLNMGDDQEGFHPYVHAETEALAAIRMLDAMEDVAPFTDVKTDQLFITGYSQGGHASMALHEYIVENETGYDVTAAAHMSGPYSLSDIMRNEVILRDTTFGTPAFLPYTILAYQEVYPELDEELSDIFRAPYVDFIADFRAGYETGEVRLDTLNVQMIRTYMEVEESDQIFPSRFLTPEFAARIADPNDKYVEALRENDTYDFVNPDSTLLIYCSGDDQVSFRNSIVAADTLNLLGAASTTAVNVGATLSHTDCILPAVRESLDFFEGFQEILSGTVLPGSDAYRWVQSGRSIYVHTGTQDRFRMDVIDALGRVYISNAAYRDGEQIDLSALPSGFVAVRLSDEQGRIASRALVLR